MQEKSGYLTSKEQKRLADDLNVGQWSENMRHAKRPKKATTCLH